MGVRMEITNRPVCCAAFVPWVKVKRAVRRFNGCYIPKDLGSWKARQIRNRPIGRLTVCARLQHQHGHLPRMGTENGILDLKIHLMFVQEIGDIPKNGQYKKRVDDHNQLFWKAQGR